VLEAAEVQDDPGVVDEGSEELVGGALAARVAVLDAVVGQRQGT
jgi:hypothetical protein